jgi:hypothetical protein
MDTDKHGSRLTSSVVPTPSPQPMRRKDADGAAQRMPTAQIAANLPTPLILHISQRRATEFPPYLVFLFFTRLRTD